MSNFDTFCKKLEAKIIAAYTDGVTMDEAEKMAAEFLAAQFRVSDELKKADLDAKMRKTGAKGIRAAYYTEFSKPGTEGKKPTEAAIAALIDGNEVVQAEQKDLDRAEVERDALERYYNIFREAHTFMRGVARGRYDGG